MEKEIIKGSVGVTKDTLNFLKTLVYDKNNISEDRPFESITEAFRFSFSLGYSLDIRQKEKAVAGNIAPRQFNVDDYETILRQICIQDGISLGALCSEYGEAGADLIIKKIKSGGTVLDFFN